MEERMSWGEAFGTAWGNLTGVNNGGSVRTIRALFILIFLLGTAWVGYSYVQAQNLLELKDYTPPARVDRAKDDKARLDKMVNEIKAISVIRSSSPSIANTMVSVAKYPFGDPMYQEQPLDRNKEITVTLPPPQVVVEYPPVITVRAIMVMGNSRVAVMDIPDVGTGLLVKAGDTFSQKKGRVVRITPEKVVIRWGDKNWDIAPSF